MSRDWEALFTSWARAPSQTEQDRADNAETAIRNALAKSTSLASRSVLVLPQGSYRNRTTVRQDSDVDVCVMCTESIFFDLPEGTTPADFGITFPASYPYTEFKNDVHSALASHFGQVAVTRGRKAFDIHENTYRVDADVLPAFRYKWYLRDRSHISGIAFVPDGGSRIVNYPDQNYDNGVAKNNRTGRRFKAVVRILKHLRNEMEANGIQVARPVPSFLIECLVWNVPDEGFAFDRYKDSVRWVLAHLFNNTMSDETCSNWKETNAFKYIFHPSQRWTRPQANTFLDEAWNYIGCE